MPVWMRGGTPLPKASAPPPQLELPQTQGAFLSPLKALLTCPQPSRDRASFYSFSMFFQTAPAHSFCIFQCELLPPWSSAFPRLCALPEKKNLPFPRFLILSSPSHLCQLTSSRKCHRFVCLHLKSQQHSLFNNCPTASNTERAPTPPPPAPAASACTKHVHTEHAPVGSSNRVISLHTQCSTQR